MALLHAWVPIPRSYYAFNLPSWGISIEFFFSLCFPVLIANWRRTWLSKLALTFILACLMVALANHFHAPPADRFDTYAANVYLEGLVHVNPLARIFEFTLGMTTALLWERWAGSMRGSRRIGTAVKLAVVVVVVGSAYYSSAIALQIRSLPFIGEPGELWLESGASPASRSRH